MISEISWEKFNIFQRFIYFRIIKKHKKIPPSKNWGMKLSNSNCQNSNCQNQLVAETTQKNVESVQKETQH